MTRAHPTWLIAVDGEERGTMQPLEQGGLPALGPEGWERQARANLFHPVGSGPLAVGDLVEYEGQMWLAAGSEPSWPGSDEDLDETDTEGALVVMPLELWVEPPVEIPAVFHSVYHGHPFPNCLICDHPLMEGRPRNYMIEKIFRGQQVILECAVCQPCAMSMNCELSEESKSRLEAFYSQLFEREAGLQACRLCDKERSQMRGFNIITTALLDRVLPESWVLLCQGCLDQMEQLLSKKTTDVYRDFLDQNFPGIPDGIDVPRPVFI